MEKYQSSVAVKERTKKNKKLYDEIQDIDVEYIDVHLDNKMEIDVDQLKEKTRKNYQKIREMEAILPTQNKPEKKEEMPIPKEERIYDINEILRRAKENRLFEEESKKRLINTEYNILTKLDMEVINQNDDLSKDHLRHLIDTIYQNEEGKSKRKKKRKKPEEDDLLADLKNTEEFVIDEELSKIILDRAQEIENPKKKEKEKKKTKEEIQEEDNDLILAEKENTPLVMESEDIEDSQELEMPEVILDTKKQEPETTDTMDQDLTDLFELEPKRKKWVYFLIAILGICLVIGAYFLYEYLSTM